MFGLLSKSSIVLNIIALMLAFIFIFILFKFESKIKNPFIPISEFNRSVSLVFVTDLLIAMSLMGYNLYIPIYLQDHSFTTSKWFGNIPTVSSLVSFKF